MKEAKRISVPLPRPKSNSKPSIAPSKTSLSQEFVDSDDESSSENMPKAQIVHRPKTTIAIHGPNGVAKTKAKSSANEPATPKPKSKSKATPKQPTPKQVVTQPQAAELSSSEQTDHSDASSQHIQPKFRGQAQQGVSSDSDTTSDSSSDKSDAPGVSQPTQKPVHAKGQSSQAKPHTVEFRPAQTFVPPRDFHFVPFNDKTKSKATHLFENLQGKQIWHITAPAGVSLKDLSEIPMENVTNGHSFWNHEGTSYGFSITEQSDDSSCEVMLPGQNGYKPLSTRISQSLHLQAIVSLPKLGLEKIDQNTGSEAAASITRSTIRAPRPQLKGLKMRFLPTGFGKGNAGTLGDSDSEDNTPQETTGSSMLDDLNLPSRKEKRKHQEVIGGMRTESALKKKKKKGIETSGDRRAKKEKKRAQAVLTGT
ncbi:DNA-directed RNA polymerase I subunit RPA34.5-domain-containing protein [Phaeosphaeriaceae sp. PMI808]|nr:DNA-directed RNA polymerase I subunit RPA34.5-domain-containing protein [Phaeosphaeriaceae sp. PMI808]